MNGVPDELEESDIPNLPDEILSMYVAKWVGWSSDVDAKPTSDGRSRLEVTWQAPDGTIHDDPPDYCNDDAAAMRLLKRLPARVDGRHQPDLVGPVIDTKQHEVAYYRGWNMHLFGEAADRLNRALAEAAATLAARGVDPREGDQ